ncbi:MAG TPA: hypothetical protein VFI46_01445 [Jiangellaceae bacterium]|nr:hypothetical protein [Jiangellaceae bacterium]
MMSVDLRQRGAAVLAARLGPHPVSDAELLLADLSRRDLEALVIAFAGVAAGEMIRLNGRKGALAEIRETIAELIIEEGS